MRQDFQALLMAGAAAVAVMAAPMTAQAQDRVQRFDIAAQDAASALNDWARQAGVQVVFPYAAVQGRRTPAVRGEFTRAQALGRLISGMPLAVSSDAGGVVTLATAQGDVAEAEPDGPAVVEEIVVTAQKREERLQDVPVPVSVIAAQSLSETNQTRIQDYYTKVPGLSLVMAEAGTPTVTIRGVTTGAYTNPTVAIVIDDLPYGSSTSSGSGYVPPDIDPSDLARVEVLRGPQGTLYGASSIGGVLKFVTVDPSTERFSGRLQAGVSGVENGDGLGHVLRGAVNMPVGDALALRLSGFTRRDPGYVDNVQTGEEGVNGTDARGGRLSVLWRPLPDVSVKLGALVQEVEREGSDEVERTPGLGDLQQDRLRGSGGYSRRSQSYSAVVNAGVGSARLVSITGYGVDEYEQSLDLSALYGSYAAPLTGANSIIRQRTTKVTQELRLDTSFGEDIDWLLGLFYTEEKTQAGGGLGGGILAADATTGALGPLLFGTATKTRYREAALFSNLTFRLSDRFDVQVGGRYGENRQRYDNAFSGPIASIFYLADPVVSPTRRSEGDAFTYLVTPRFRISPDLMVYARLASGYRPGGPNINGGLPGGAGTPTDFDADTTTNWEVGLKGNAFDGKLSFEASAYYVDWKDIQLLLQDPTTFTTYYANGSRAKSEGVELSVQARPWQGGVISAWVAWNNARLTEGFPAGSPYTGRKGDRLPFSSPFSGAVSVDQEFSLGGDTTAYVGGSLSFVDDRRGQFQLFFIPGRETFPSYTQLDLRAGVRFSSVSVNLFANNVADERGVLRGGLDNGINPNAYSYTQPRTIGVSVTKSF